MKKTLTGLALSIAVALSTPSLFAKGGGGAGGGGAAGGGGGGAAASSNAGTSAGSNAGTHTGSNAGANTGSNGGANMGSNAAGNSNNANNINNANNASNADHTNNANNANNTNNGRGGLNNQPAIGNGNNGGGGDNSGGVTSGDVQNTGPVVTPVVPQKQVDYGQHPANGTTPPSTNPITADKSLTTADVPAPASVPTAAGPAKGMAIVTANQHAQLEGRIVDVMSANPAAPVATGSATPLVTGANSIAAVPDARTNSASADIVQRPHVSPAGNSSGNLEATATVRKTGEETFGTYARPGATANSTSAAGAASATPDAAATPAPAATPPTPTGDNARVIVNSSPSVAPVAPAHDQAAIMRQLNAGMPAALQVGTQTYVLACDPHQLASYAGQTARIRGRLTASGVLIPESLEVRQPSGTFRSISLAPPLESTPTANER